MNSRIFINGSFIHLGMRGFLGRRKKSRAAYGASPRADGRDSGRKMREPRYIHPMNRPYRARIYFGWRTTSCRGRDERPYVDSNIIILVINPSRPEPAAVHLSIRYSIASAGESSSDRRDSLGQRNELALRQRGEARAEERTSRGISIK